MSPFYRKVIHVGPAVLLVIAAVNFVGSLALVFGVPVRPNPLFGLSASLTSALLPLIAAFVLLRFDQWFASTQTGVDQ
ncbi:hypothetical protein [Sphingomonas sp. 2SG]|uniref:hypothetical protein n=1 Tax=Sphingomonas sp. 2SG TaxID=2502201 RepID=UPI0010F9D696|nr:hypothetical protein [Sphingomonas sp. 2SG]